MNILIITNITKNPTSGLSNIIPYYVKYLSRVENVSWLNLYTQYIVDEDLSHLYYTKIEDVVNKYKMLESKIDIAIFHGIYFYEYYRISKKLLRWDIPYIITPHGSLTKSSLNTKRIKKQLGIYIFIKKFVENAKSIHYLSLGEKEASSIPWNRNSFVIGNGVEMPNYCKTKFRTEEIRGVYIGRLTIYHKGIDLLLEACVNLKEFLLYNNVKIDLYGPGENNSRDIILNKITENGLENIIFLNEGIFGKDKKKILLESDFFLLTSRSEGHPLSVLEALSIGLPCLVTEGTNMAHQIESYNAGWTAETSILGIETALKQLVIEKNQLYTKSENAINLAKSYSWDRIAEMLCFNYKKVTEM